MGPELGLSLPGCLIVCGDSHTCTHGGMGALAFGVGSSELAHVLATQTLRAAPAQDACASTSRARWRPGVTPKDLILHLIGEIGAAGGTGYAVEYAGSAIRALDVEGRLTICNLSIELGAKMGLVAPDDTDLSPISQGRPFAPKGDACGIAPSRPGARCRATPTRCSTGRWRSTSAPSPRRSPGAPAPSTSSPSTSASPTRQRSATRAGAAAWRRRSTTWASSPATPIAGTPVDWVFIGSCTNSRLSDLRAAAAVVRGRKVAEGVRAWVVPGSETVKRDAVAEGLDRVFLDAGFEWREPGCSMCLAANGETVPPGQRSVSTSNRNFVGRQGPRARTHLASPAMAAAAAIAGAIADVRRMGS